MDLTLVVLAAGMGSRYGGNKQLDGIGPNGEIIMDANTGRPLGSDSYEMDDPFADNDKYQSDAATFIDFSETDPFSEGNY